MPDLVTLLDWLPAGVRRFARRVAAGRGMLGRLTDAMRFRFSESEIPRLPKPGDASIRVVIGPANSAGQGYRWARAIERYLPSVSATAVHGLGTDPFRASADVRVPVAVYQRAESWHVEFEEYLAKQTHVVWESALPLLGRRYGSDAVAEMQWAAGRGVRPALMFHGSDIRPPTRHADGNRWSPFRDRSGPVRLMEERTLRNAKIASDSGAPVFVSTPDLLQWLPTATWCPVAVDPTVWRHAAVAKHRPGRLVVAHAPSQGWLKGTSHIEPTLRRLEASGIIEYRRITEVPHAKMPDFYAGADVVLDQFVLGIYGVAACEAMASGRLVMSHVDDFTRAQVRERTGLDLPIHETTIETLEAELRLAASDPDTFDSLRAAGPVFVDTVHDGRRSAVALAPFLGVSA